MKALDADVLIGFLDPGDAHHSRSVRIISAALEQREELIIGASAYSEVLVHASAKGRPEAVDEMIDDAAIDVRAVDRPTAKAAAELRARHRSLRLPDAMALATALRYGAELVSFDRRLLRIAAAETV